MLSNIVRASGGRSVFFVAAFLRNILLARIVGPSELGLWSFGLVLLQYGQWSHGTILAAFRLDGPRKRGAGLGAEVDDLRRLTWTALTFPAVAVVVGAFAVSSMMPNTAIRWSVIMLAAVLLPQQLYLFATSYLAVDNKFAAMARLQVTYAALNLIVTIPLAWRWGFKGAVAAQVFSYTAVLLMFGRTVPLVMRPLWNRRLLREQFWLGLPVGLNGIIYTLFVTMDRTVLASVAGVAALGQYSLTVFARSSLGMLPDAVGEVVYVRTSARVGAKESIPSILTMIRRADVLTAWAAAGVIGISVIWVEWLVQLLLPAYRPGIGALRIFMVGMFFTFPAYAAVLLTSLGRATAVMKYYAVATAVQMVLVAILVRTSGINGAAIATAVSSAILFFILNWHGIGSVTDEPVWPHTVRCVLPWIMMLAGVLVSQFVPNASGVGFAALPHLVGCTVVYMSVFGAAIFAAFGRFRQQVTG